MNANATKSAKNALRRLALSRRRAITEADAVAKSELIQQRAWDMPEVQRAASVLCYVSARDREVITHRLIGQLLAAGKALWVPVTEADGTMRWSRLSAFSELAPGKFGILEPAPMYQRFLPWTDPAVCLTPGLLFTPGGHRIGYGKGCFDRFLGEHPLFSIGLAYDAQIESALPLEGHDVALNCVLTESRRYEGGKASTA